MKKKCIAMLLAGGQGSRLYALTVSTAKPDMPFGGKYRIIDFPLSNCANSGIDTVGVLTQYQPLQLNRYIGSGRAWDLDVVSGGVYILPPYLRMGEKNSWFSGTSNAIYQNMGFIELYDPQYVVILSGDHVYKMDYSEMLEEHIANNADCTIACLRVSLADATRFGIMNPGPDGYISQFEEKPKYPKSDLASMGIYIFTWEKLKAYLISDELDPKSENDFGKNIIPSMLNGGEKIWPYLFSGYWRDVGTITSLWDANMDMLSDSRLDMNDERWPIKSNLQALPPHYVGEKGNVIHSIVTEGCIINGDVQNSILSNSVVIQEGAIVDYSVIMPGVVIESGAVVEYAILGENTRVCSGAHVGSSPDGSPDWCVATCGPDIVIGAGSHIEAGAMVYESVEVKK